ncbi:hypothetical protein GJ496_002434 [Pomphorhynchus laevis]|nr:hypothetical protein GJ496_002434 [Pomphorhynchus laevis]
MKLTNWFHWIHSSINTTNLAGSIDVVVIKHQDGSLRASPFYVRFGKLDVLNSEGKDVYIHVNGNPADIHMILSDEGQAYFRETTVKLIDDTNMIANEMSASDSNLDDVVHLNSSSIVENNQSTISVVDLQSQQLKAVERSIYEQREIDQLFKNKYIDKQSTQQRKIQTFNKQATSKQRRPVIRRRSSSYDSNCMSEEDPNILTPPKHADRQINKQRTKEIKKDNLNIMKGTMTDEDLRRQNDIIQKLQSTIEQQASHQSFVTDDGIARCQSDSDLDKRRGIPSTEATFFLASGRKAISEIVLRCNYKEVEDNNTLDKIDNENCYYSYSNSRSCSCIGTAYSKCKQASTFFQDEPFVFSISSISEAVCYIQHMKNELDKLSSISRNRKISSTNLITELADSLVSATSVVDSKSSPDTCDHSPDLNVDTRACFPSHTKDIDSECLGGYTNQLFSDRQSSGMYLEDALNKAIVDPEISSLYLNRIGCNFMDDELDSSNRGASLSSTPNVMDTLSLILGNVAISDCGGLSSQDITSELFEKSLINKEKFIQNPDVIHSPNLVVRINNRYYNWKTASPMIIAACIFHQRLSKDSVDKLVEQHMPTTNYIVENKSAVETATGGSSWWIFGRGWAYNSYQQSKNREVTVNDDAVIKGDIKESHHITNVTSVMESSVRQQTKSHRISLTSEELKSLNLRYGENEVTFSVTTALQGTSVVTASVFLFNESDRFVISDIDGTITRSDVIGQILPLVGRDWSHDGIAEFFCAIADNGYNFIYVSSRSIGQSALTKGYLGRLRQKGFELPSGPVLLSPDSLFNALYREVVASKPEEFKIDCLKTIATLFPENICPFYAGFGNRVNDQWAYTSVGIPLQRIFTINPSGIVKHHASDYSSYNTLHEIVDQLFPPIFKGGTSLHGPQEYSTFTYWRNEM